MNTIKHSICLMALALYGCSLVDQEPPVEEEAVPFSEITINDMLWDEYFPEDLRVRDSVMTYALGEIGDNERLVFARTVHYHSSRWESYGFVLRLSDEDDFWNGYDRSFCLEEGDGPRHARTSTTSFSEYHVDRAVASYNLYDPENPPCVHVRYPVGPQGMAEATFDAVLIRSRAINNPSRRWGNTVHVQGIIRSHIDDMRTRAE